MSEPWRYAPDVGPHGRRGLPVDPARCRASVSTGTGRGSWFAAPKQCERKAKHGEWCGQHDPAARDARAAKNQEEREAKRKREADSSVAHWLGKATTEQLRAELKRRGEQS